MASYSILTHGAFAESNHVQRPSIPRASSPTLHIHLTASLRP